MESLEQQAESVINAVTAGKATPSTATALRALLQLGSGAKNESLNRKPNSETRAKSKSRLVKTVQIARGTSGSSAKELPFRIHEDESKGLSAKAKQALATTVVNAVLKYLSQVAKSQPKSRQRSQDNAKQAPPQGRCEVLRSSQDSPTSQRALQPRSGNTTPKRRSPDKPTESRESSASSPRRAKTSPHGVLHETSATAECGAHAFAFLFSTTPPNLESTSPRSLQLEKGILSFCGRLIDLKLELLSVKALQTIKRRLEAYASSMQDSASNTKQKKLPADHAAPGSSTLSSLLRLDLDENAGLDILCLATAYQVEVLKCISCQRKPASIASTLQYLSVSEPGGPVNIIEQCVNLSRDISKGARQLEALSQLILDLCPSVSIAKDDEASDLSVNPEPRVIFMLQSIALQVRKAAKDLKQDESEASQPQTSAFFSKFLSTYLRRASASNLVETYDVVAKAYTKLELSNANQDEALFKIHRGLSILAERASLPEEAASWAGKASDDSQVLESSHALRIAALARNLALQLRLGSCKRTPDSLDEQLGILAQTLESKVTGTTSDLDILLTELTYLAHHLGRDGSDGMTTSQSQLSGAICRFTAQYCRLYPDMGCKHAVSVFTSIVAHCRSMEELASWVTRDAAQAMVHAGILLAVSKAASSCVLSEAWSSSKSALILSRILKSLAHKAVHTSPETCMQFFYDHDDLPVDERGTLLEWQLVQALSHLRKKRHTATGNKLLAEILERLDECYKAHEYPVRRARVATLVLRKAQEDSDLIAPTTLSVWEKCAPVDEANLGHDQGLSRFTEDTNAMLAAARAFHTTVPEPSTLLAIILPWRDLLDKSRDASREQTLCDTSDLIAQLRGLDDYFAMLGYHEERLPVLQMLLRAAYYPDRSQTERFSILLRLFNAHLSIGLTDNARQMLLFVEQYITLADLPKSKIFHYYVCQSELSMLVDDLPKCREALERAQDIRDEIGDQEMDSTSLSKDFQLVVSRYLLTQSRLSFASGASHDALRIAKQVARTLNAVWSSSERSSKQDISETDGSTFSEEVASVNGLSKGISKLNLKPQSEATSGSTVKGVAFWTVIPRLCEALSHLSDVIAHHGLFRDALSCLNQAVKVAETQKFSKIMLHLLIQRSKLYINAGQVGSAELDLATTQEGIPKASSLTRVHLLRAQADLRSKEGLLEKASDLYREAEHILKELQSRFENLGTNNVTEVILDFTSPASDHENLPARAVPRATAPVSATRVSRSKTVTSSKTRAARRSPIEPQTDNCSNQAQSNNLYRSHSVHKLMAEVVLDQTIATFKANGHVASLISRLQDLFVSLPGTSRQRQVEYYGVMRKVTSALLQDVSFNVLPESTLALPALSQPVSEIHGLSMSNPSASCKSPKKSSRKTAAVPSRKQKAAPVETLESLLLAASGCMIAEQNWIRTTTETHQELGMVSTANMLLSATCATSSQSLQGPIEGALAIELPRITAALRRSASARVEMELHEDKRSRGQTCTGRLEDCSSLTAQGFQKQYIDILPRPWTVVSLSLSEDAEELYVSRYREGCAPLILKLPFARHKPDGEDDEPFDFDTGKAELQDIIDLSNYSCHQSIDTRSKTARDKWWNEREALDRRLEELLINIENIWLGGFKGVFSQQRSDPDALAHFRSAFEATLERHLPSRNGTKRDAERLVVEDAILELFTGLAIDVEGEPDLDEPLADLLYFVVDMLQFNGERNAYDEIDFDAMSVEVFDALCAYHRRIPDEDDTQKHTILVLDRRIQVFPWESLPCLDEVSVSRVDSMLTLRERILLMRDQSKDRRAKLDSSVGSSFYGVSRCSGSYILNPSGDLKHTEESLNPVLSTLETSEGSNWSSIARRAPSQQEFHNSLSGSSTLLYFGHGTATQYIRARAIRQLERCSEVVWLMGCSSGSVTEHGDFEPSAVPFEYLSAGQSREESCKEGESAETSQCKPRKCMAVLAMLWDVTDKDIDRFSLAVGNEWNLWTASTTQTKLPAKAVRRREVVAVPSTPGQVLKTPKTPKVRNTPAPTRTPARSRSRASRVQRGKCSLVEAVAKSRDVCYLRYLNGAAPVVYGVPVYLED